MSDDMSISRGDYAAEVVCGNAEAIAWRAHTTAPAIEHTAQVAAGVDHLLDQAVAWLHSVIEDTEWTREGLDSYPVGMTEQEQHMWQGVVADVALLTRVEGQSEEQYQARIALSPRARRVKLACDRSPLIP